MKMPKKSAIFLFILFLLCMPILAQDAKKLQSEIGRLNKKLAQTKNKKTRGLIQDKIDFYQLKLDRLKKRAVKGPGTGKRIVLPAVPVEAAPEETGGTPEVVEEIETGKAVESYKFFRLEAGGVTGFFGGATSFMMETRFPLARSFGPAAASLRMSTGLAQNREMDRRYVPLCADVVLNFPPGWFSTTRNYIGAGLNYTVLTTGRVAGSVGGQLFYGAESEGFGGIIFGELGYGILRTGFSGSHKGVTTLVGYRRIAGL